MQADNKVTEKEDDKDKVIYFQMSVKEDQIDSVNGGSLNALVFDQENQKKLLWNFLSLGFFFPKSYITSLIVVSQTRLVFSKLGCEESTSWFSLLLCIVGYALPNQKQWKKIISFSD